MIVKAVTFRLYPTKDQVRRIEKSLDLHRELYNAALQERRDAWEKCKISVSRYEQQRQIKEVWKDRPDFKEFVSSRSAEDVVLRLDLAFRSFFRRMKAGEKPGYPRFKNRRSYTSFSISGNKNFKTFTTKNLSIPKIGRVRWRPWCAFPGKPKLITVKRLPDGYFATVVFECLDPTPLPKTGKSVGVDLGMTSIVATSDGEVVPAQKLLVKNERKMRAAHRMVSRRKKGSNRRRKAVALLARAHQKLARCRKHFLDGVTKRLVGAYDLIAVEDLSPQKMRRLGGRGARGRGFRRSFKDAAWGLLLHQLEYKAAWAGRVLVKVDPRGTSQECSECGERVEKTLRERTHRCPHCGLSIDRDVNAARNVHQRALRALRGEGAPSGPSTKREVST